MSRCCCVTAHSVQAHHSVDSRPGLAALATLGPHRPLRAWAAPRPRTSPPATATQTVTHQRDDCLLLMFWSPVSVILFSDPHPLTLQTPGWWHDGDVTMVSVAGARPRHSPLSPLTGCWPLGQVTAPHNWVPPSSLAQPSPGPPWGTNGKTSNTRAQTHHTLCREKKTF